MFTQARIKLTVFYVLIIICIISVFSFVLFHYTVQHIRDNVEEDGPRRDIQEIIVTNTIGQLQTSLLIADLVVVVVAGLLSYWLAGKTIRPIQDALYAQEQFSAHASHELRTPLSVMRTENEVFLKNKQLPSQARVLATSNLEEINRMTSMVENLLMLARSKKVDVKIETAKVNIAEIIKTVLTKTTSFAESKHLVLVSNIPDTVYILGNEKLLEQLFFNLIQNAVTYTNTGHIEIAAVIKDVTIISIKDTGIGISEENLKHIFEPFYKADESRTQSSTGVGLGLSIVKEIVEKHNGTIKISSELNKGTKVTVTFPTYLK